MIKDKQDSHKLFKLIDENLFYQVMQEYFKENKNIISLTSALEIPILNIVSNYNKKIKRLNNENR